MPMPTAATSMAKIVCFDIFSPKRNLANIAVKKGAEAIVKVIFATEV